MVTWGLIRDFSYIDPPRGGELTFIQIFEKVMADQETTVLVHFYQRVRPVKFIGNKDALAESFKTTFKDVLQGGSIIFEVSVSSGAAGGPVSLHH